ncbi:hypothetical protein M011DRAFT_427105 [Sporormia fimetaria CBS 119925]|uniref:C2H2-type domain-containing protein n=1 Tax=Sporormia fimetaria CBS 119925 TaxID=1340428 RepID=A0A6A6V7G4_9PLEO|nr:hypothetical protein M011DRAFT_427105 [Sporormia fimetaria CBS 119925]
MDSELSDYASDDFPEEVKGRHASPDHSPDLEPSLRPSKRARLSNMHASPDPALTLPGPGEAGELSEDTDGSVPASPHHPGMTAEDDYGQDQVTVCKWEGCSAGDLDNMDRLVEHLHDDHIGVRQKKYSCEWSDCARKGIPHASGYALRAHMRSHTREKPFYCTLPECDRSFTRSDALAKHMRTVHETEALRPSDPVPKHHSSNPSNKFQRLRLVLYDDRHKSKGSTPASPSSHAPASTTAPTAVDAEYAQNNGVYVHNPNAPGTPDMVEFPPDVQFTPEELALPAPALFRLLCRQLNWATQEGEALKAKAKELEALRKEEWVEKELLFENYMEAELATAKRRRLEKGLPGDPEAFALMEKDAQVSKQLEIKPAVRKTPWWREPQWVEKLGFSKVDGEGQRSEERQPSAAAGENGQ